MADSRNILIDVVFGKDSLTKISSADMREFVNSVYDELMNKDNIADDLITLDPTQTLSAKQGVQLQENITDVADEVNNLIKSQATQDNKITQMGNTIGANAVAVGLNLKEITEIQNVVQGVKAQAVTNANDLQKQEIKINTNNSKIYTLKQELIQTDGIIDRIEANEKSIGQINKTLGKDTTDLKTLVRDIKVNEDAIKVINTQVIPGISSRITNLLSQANQEMARIDKKTDSFRADIDKNENDIRSTQTSVMAAQTAISNHNQSFFTINQDISTIEGKLSNIYKWEKTIVSSESKIQKALVDINNTKNLADNNKIRLDVADVATKAQDAKITKIKIHTDDNTQKTSSIKKTLLALSNQSSQTQSKVNSLGNNIIDHTRRITTLENTHSQSAQGIAGLRTDVQANSAAINNNKLQINTGYQTMKVIQGDIATIKNTATALDTDVKANKTKIEDHQTEIVKNQNDIQNIKDGTVKLSKVAIQSDQNQIDIQSTTASGSTTSIIGRDSTSSAIWTIGTEKGNTDLVLKADKIRLSSPNAAVLETKDPIDPTKTKEYKILGLSTTATPQDDGDMLFWNAPAKEWGVQSIDDTRTKLSVFTQQETFDEITSHWNASIQDHKNNYLDQNYYTKGEVYDKQDVDDALTHQVKFTDLLNYGTGFATSSVEFKRWEKLRDYNPQTAPQDETPIADIQVAAFTDLAEAEQEIRRSRAEIIELQRKVNDLLSVLKTSGVLI